MLETVPGADFDPRLQLEDYQVHEEEGENICKMFRSDNSLPFGISSMALLWILLEAAFSHLETDKVLIFSTKSRVHT